nr:hypothetical protein CFP56_64326 [Quercus suber]
MNRDIGSRLANEIGDLVTVDIPRSGGFGWGPFLRIRVNIEITKPLMCGILGHNEQECPQRKTRRLLMEDGDFQYGHGLRAVTLRQKIQSSAQHNLHSHYETPVPNNQEVDDNANVSRGDLE